MDDEQSPEECPAHTPMDQLKQELTTLTEQAIKNLHRKLTRHEPASPVPYRGTSPVDLVCVKHTALVHVNLF
jgi:hypothetical protein